MRNQKLLAVLIFLLTVLAIRQFLLPEFDNYQQLDKELTKKINEYQDYNKIKDSLLSKSKQDKQIIDKLKRLELILPRDFRQDFYIEQISSIAANNGLILEGASIEQDKFSGGAGLFNIILTIDISGTYDDFKKFLTDIRNNITPYEILEFVADTSGYKSERDYLKYNMKILTRINL